MFVSILQRFISGLLQGAVQPLQSRAGRNTRKLLLSRILDAGLCRKTPSRQVGQQQRSGRDCLSAACSGSHRESFMAPQFLRPRGDSL